MLTVSNKLVLQEPDAATYIYNSDKIFDDNPHRYARFKKCFVSQPYIPDWLDVTLLCSLVELDVTYAHNWDVSRAVTIRNLYGNIQGMTDWDTSSVRNVGEGLVHASGDIRYLSKLNTRSVADMTFLFGVKICGDIKHIANWDIGNVRYADYIFTESSISGDISALSRWNTGSLSKARSLFSNSGLRGNIAAISKWCTPQLEDAGWMFDNRNIFGRLVN